MVNFRLLLVAAAAAVAGCGPNEAAMPTLHPVQGKALLASGKPAAFVDLEFYPTAAGSIKASAKTDAAGAFAPKSAGQDGMAAGTFKVVAKASAKTGARLDPNLGEDSSTQLTVTVTAREPALTVTLN